MHSGWPRQPSFANGQSAILNSGWPRQPSAANGQLNQPFLVIALSCVDIPCAVLPTSAHCITISRALSIVMSCWRRDPECVSISVWVEPGAGGWVVVAVGMGGRVLVGGWCWSVLGGAGWCWVSGRDGGWVGRGLCAGVRTGKLGAVFSGGVVVGWWSAGAGFGYGRSSM